MVELNAFLKDGKTIYSIANAGDIWFVEYDDHNFNINDNRDHSEEVIEKLIRLKLLRLKSDGVSIYTLMSSDIKTIAQVIKCENEATKNSLAAYLEHNSICPLSDVLTIIHKA
jgi:hypothetical protein